MDQRDQSLIRLDKWLDRRGPPWTAARSVASVLEIGHIWPYSPLVPLVQVFADHCTNAGVTAIPSRYVSKVD